MRINLPKTYSQLGNNTPIGNSTIDAIGCLTVCAAMTATYFGHPIDPSTLAKSVTYQGNLWVWGALTGLYGDIVYKGQIQTPSRLTDYQINQIKGLIDSGIPVFIQISTQSIPEHWLLAVDYNGEDLLVSDPLRQGGQIHPITDYGIQPREVIYAYAWYSGKVPTSQSQGSSQGDYYRGYDLTNKDSMKVAVDQMLKIVNGEVIEKSQLETVKKDYENRLSQKDEKIKQLTDEIAKKDGELSKASEQAKIDAAKIKELETKLLNLPDEAAIRAAVKKEFETTIITNLFKK